VFLIQQHIEYTLNISNNYLIKKNIIIIIEFAFGLENLIVDHYAQVIGRYEQEAAALDEPTYYLRRHA